MKINLYNDILKKESSDFSWSSFCMGDFEIRHNRNLDLCYLYIKIPDGGLKFIKSYSKDHL